MNAHWRVRRTVSAQDTGQQRWDLAYQCLLRWREHSSGPPCTETEGGDNGSCIFGPFGLLMASNHFCDEF